MKILERVIERRVRNIVKIDSMQFGFMAGKSTTDAIFVVRQPGASFQLFLGGPNFYKYFNATGLLKNWKKQHFICSNLTLFIVPFFLFFSFFSLFSFFFSFSLGATAPQPPSNDAPVASYRRSIWQRIKSFVCVQILLFGRRTRFWWRCSGSG